MKREVEILWRLRDTKARVIRIMRSLDRFEDCGVKRIVDTYYFDPKRATLKPDRNGRLKECLRLRQKNDKNSLTYKVDHFRGNGWLYSDEHETEVADHDVMKDIARLLGFKLLVEVDMKKQVFCSRDLEVVVEDVKGLGLFIEVETRMKVKKNDVAAEKERIRRFLLAAGICVGEELNMGKPEMLLRRQPMHRK